MSDISTVTKALNRLFSSYPQFNATTEAIGAYLEAVEPYGAEDVKSAVNDFLTGRVEDFNPSYAPSAPLVGKVSRSKYLERMDIEHAQRRAALPPPQPVPEITQEELARRRSFIARMAAENPILRAIVTAGDDKEARDD